MRLIRFSTNHDAPQVGVVADGRVVPLSALIPDAPTGMREVIKRWNEIVPELSNAESSDAAISLSSVNVLTPVDAPEKVLAIGVNYAGHVEEARRAGYDVPADQVWFCKQPNALNSPFGDIEMPKVSSELDYEVELVVVIGKGGRHISREEAPDHVFGYAVGNDVSVRDWQTRTTQWMLGKSFDTHGPVGPAIVTADEIGDPHRLDIKCYVNGELRQNANTGELVHSVWEEIAELSKAMTLKPGDLIFTGTPGGVGLAFDPPKMLKVGDVVRCEIEELGAIENKVVAEA